MPYEWHEIDEAPAEMTGASSHERPEGVHVYVLSLWPYRSLTNRGFVIFIGITAALFLAPLIPLLGTPVLWGLLPFLIGALATIWYFLNRSYKDAEIFEELRISTGRIDLIRRSAKERDQTWSENPYWVKPKLYTSEGPVPHYLTLKGKGREVELGSFLSEDERKALFNELTDMLRQINVNSRLPERT